MITKQRPFRKRAKKKLLKPLNFLVNPLQNFWLNKNNLDFSKSSLGKGSKEFFLPFGKDSKKKQRKVLFTKGVFMTAGQHKGEMTQVLMKKSVHLAVAVYVAVALIAAFACVMLPFETKGHDLSDNNRGKSNLKS